MAGCQKTPPYQPKPLDASVSYDDIYLIMGQSNATGVAPWSFLESKDNEIYQKFTKGEDKVLIACDVDNTVNKEFVPVKFGKGAGDTYFGPEIGITNELAKGDKTSYIIKATYSGSCLRTQYVNEYGTKFELYNRYISFIKDRLEALEQEGKTPRLRGVFWMQGESDSNLKRASFYRTAQQYFYENLRSDLNNWIYDHFNFVDAFISSHSSYWVNDQDINRAKLLFAKENENAYCIKTNGEDEEAINLTLKSESGEENDDAHYDSTSMVLLGKTAAKYLVL